MKPIEIRIKMLRLNICQADIARKAGKSRAAVCRTINGSIKSKFIQNLISESIGIPVAKIWPPKKSKC